MESKKKPDTFAVRLVKKGTLSDGGEMHMDMTYRLPFKYFGVFIEFMESQGIRSIRKKKFNPPTTN